MDLGAVWHIHRFKDYMHRPVCFGAFFVLFGVPLVGRGELPSAHTMKQKGQRLQETVLHSGTVVRCAEQRVQRMARCFSTDWAAARA